MRNFMKMRKVGISHRVVKQPGIYAIICEHDDAKDSAGNPLFYIGKSTNMGQRYWQHLSELKNGVHVNKLLQNLWDTYGSKWFTMLCLEVVDDIDSIESRERYYVESLCPQLNIRAVKLSKTDVEDIRSSIAAGVTHSDICSKYSITPKYLSEILRGSRW